MPNRNDLLNLLKGYIPHTRTVNDEYLSGDGTPWSMKWNGIENDNGSAIRAGSYGDPANPNYFAGAFWGGDRNFIPDFDKTFNTPLGDLEFSRNTEAPNSIFADFYPSERAQAYISALQNLLK